MSEFSPIEWTDATWNPLLGCDKCSPGCVRCYAIRTAWRLQHNPNPRVAAAYGGLVDQRPDGSLNWTGKINLLPERLQEPMGWKKPRRIFVNSQSDLFHPDVPDVFIDQAFAVMANCRQHTFQVLTKRAARMHDYLSSRDRLNRIYIQWSSVSGAPEEAQGWPLPNVHIGVSVEDQKADWRIKFLVDTPAAIRFLSCEPLIGPLDLIAYLGVTRDGDRWARRADLCDWRPYLHWIIVGGESGPGARPMHPAWAQSLRDQCAAASIPFLFKQWGEWGDGRFGQRRTDAHRFPQSGPMAGDERIVYRVGKKAAGRLLDGVEHNGFPTVEARA